MPLLLIVGVLREEARHEMPIEQTADGQAEVWWGKIGCYSPLAVNLEPCRGYESKEQYGRWWFYLTLGYTSARGTQRVLEFAQMLEHRADYAEEFRVLWQDERGRPIRFMIAREKALAVAAKLREIIRYYGWHSNTLLV